MAIYHLSVSNVSRASGSKATATLSYISGRRVHDERRGETYDYGRKERVLRVGTLLPEGAPSILGFIMAPGGFITLGVLLAAVAAIGNAKKKRLEARREV